MTEIETIRSDRDATVVWKRTFWGVIGCVLVLSTLNGAYAGDAFSNRGVIPMCVLSSSVFLGCMIGAYAGLGKSKLRWLLLLCATPVLGMLTPWFCTSRLNEVMEFTLFQCTIAGVVALTTSGLRFFKGQLIKVSEDSITSDGLQFGIRDVLVWTGVLAALFAIGKQFLNLESIADLETIVLIVSLGTAIAISSVICVWGLLGESITLIKGLVLVGGLVVSFTLVTIVQELRFAVMALGSQVLVVFMTFIVRKQRYRFVRVD